MPFSKKKFQVGQRYQTPTSTQRHVRGMRDTTPSVERVRSRGGGGGVCGGQCFDRIDHKTNEQDKRANKETKEQGNEEANKIIRSRKAFPHDRLNNQKTINYTP